MKKNITFSAEGMIIQLAQKKASSENTTLNTLFRLWLKNYINLSDSKSRFDKIMKKVEYTKPGRSFTREEMNER